MSTVRTTRKASIIIPNYNGRQHLERLLPSLANQTYDDYEVIVIDDCSPDRSAVEYVKTFIKDCKNMRLVENTENVGFVKTCNSGFRLADGDYVCTLNNDTTVERNFVERNVQVMDAESSIGVLSCIIVDQHGNNWFSGGVFKAGLRANLQDNFEGVRMVDWVAGTACFYRRELFDKVGLLDDIFVMYHEDIDFCLRVTEQTSYKVCMFSDRLVTHYLDHHEPLRLSLARLARLHYYGRKNTILLAKRHCPEYLPKTVLRNLRDIIRVPIGTISQRIRSPLKVICQRMFKGLMLSGYLAVLIILGTLAGLFKDAKLKEV